MKKNIFILIFLIVSISSLYAQRVVEVNPFIDLKQSDNKAIVELYKTYINLIGTDSIFTQEIWSNNDKIKYKSQDLLLSSGVYNPNIYEIANPYIMSISNVGKNKLLKVMFYSKGNEPNSLIPWAITNYLLIKEKDRYFLSNYSNYLTLNWLVYDTKWFEYIYYPSFPFDERNAEKANAFLERIISLFKLPEPTEKIKYFIANNCTEIQQLRGYEFVAIKNNSYDFCGYYDTKNNIVFSNSIKGEFYEHEIIHYLNVHFPKANSILLAGISAYITEDGKGHLNENLNYHISKINSYLENHPEINLNNPNQFNKLDDRTNPFYITGAILCHEIIQKGGMKLLIEVFENKSNLEFKDLICKSLNIEECDLNLFLREKYIYYSKSKFINILK